MNTLISNFLQERIDAGDFPSAVYLVAEKGEIVFHDALGYAVVEPEKIEATKDTIYDLASLTKPLVTGLLAAKLIEKRELWLNDPISESLESFDVADKRNIIVENLTDHTSGLTAWLPLYQLAETSDQIIDLIATQALEYQTDSQVLYSDLNFIVLQAIIVKVVGKTLNEIAEIEIFEPLGLNDMGFNPARELRPRIAASEKGRAYEKQMWADRGYSTGLSITVPQGSECVIWGNVHDGNASFMGGVAGHAGLFATAAQVFTLAQQFLPNSTSLLRPDMCELFKENIEPALNEDRSFAFQLASTKDSTAGTMMSPESFGHTGFTGTSLWIDPVKERVFVLLTNRTHNHPLPFVNINSVRRRFHDLAIDLLDNKTSN